MKTEWIIKKLTPDITSIIQTDKNIEVARVFSSCKISKQVAEQNAKLIVAAPDLLAACQRVAEYSDTEGFEMCIEAIKKATE